MKPGLPVFDLDGTLIETLAVEIATTRAAIAALFAARGYHQPMRPLLAAIDAAARATAQSEAERLELRARARALLDAAELTAAATARARNGAAEVQRRAVEGLRVAVVTDNGRA